MVTDSNFLASDFDSIQSEDIKHVWYFQPILEHMFICHASPSNKAHISLWVCCGQNIFKVWECMIFSHVVYDAQFSFVTIYKVG